MSDEKITAAGEEAVRSHILGLVADYCDKYHKKRSLRRGAANSLCVPRL